jgi:hypothetical protein
VLSLYNNTIAVWDISYCTLTLSEYADYYYASERNREIEVRRYEEHQVKMEQEREKAEQEKKMRLERAEELFNKGILEERKQDKKWFGKKDYSYPKQLFREAAELGLEAAKIKFRQYPDNI